MEPDLIVLRHADSVPAGQRDPRWEGLWLDRAGMRYQPGHVDGEAVAEATGRFEVNDAGKVAEVWEIRLTGRV